MTKHIHIDNMDIEVWWNEYDLPFNMPDEDVPVCVTVYRDKSYMDYRTMTMTRQEEIEFGIHPDNRVEFTEWHTPSYFLTTQKLSPRIREWVEATIERFITTDE